MAAASEAAAATEPTTATAAADAAVSKANNGSAAASATASTSASWSVTVRETNPYLMLSYATIVGLWGASQVILIPYVLHLLVLVTAILYAACHGSLILLDHSGNENNEKDEDTGSSMHSNKSSMSDNRETLKKEDALQFPIIGSISLFSLYLAFKFLDKDLVNLIIGGYFGIVGCVAMTMTFAPAVAQILPSHIARKKFSWEYKWNHSLPEWLLGPSPFELSLEVNVAELVALMISLIVCGFYVYSKPWFLNNVIGICFCLQGIERFSLGTYKIGAILLIGLFFYDIFWVFGTEVMVTVAKNLDGPIKILFPRDSLERNPETGKLDLSLLGLGDIVIPGFFLALLLRFDAHNAMQPSSSTTTTTTTQPTHTSSSALFARPHDLFEKPYFHAALFAYVLGLGTTMFVMIRFNSAQPALLYLVPACLFSSLGCALVRGEVKQLFDYSEEEEEEEDGDEDKTKEAKKDD